MKLFNASFITSGTEQYPGTLADTGLNEAEPYHGFLVFLWLIGTVYFKKYGISKPSPVALFNKHNENSLAQHNAWLEDIRQSMWDKTQFEVETIPSTEALYHHWKRVYMWRQATLELHPLTEFGWKTYVLTTDINWDSLTQSMNGSQSC